MYDAKADVAAILAYAEKPDADPAARLALISTLSRYQEQLRQLQRLKADIDSRGTVIALGDGKLQTNPAIAEYSKVTSAANMTARAMLQLYNTVNSEPEDDEL